MDAQLAVHHVQGVGVRALQRSHSAGADGVVDGVGVIADDGLNLGVGFCVGRGGQLLATVTGEGGLAQNRAHLLKTLHHAAHVVRVSQEVGVNHRRG